MAAGSVLSTAAVGGGEYVNGHGHGNHSHSRKSTSQRTPLHSTSINGGHLVNGGQPQTNPLKLQDHSHPVHSNSSTNLLVINQQQPDKNLPLPAPQLSFTDSNGRPKGMERRRSSVGLPTHLRLGSNGYGFAPASTHSYVSSKDGANRKWITVSEVISALIIPLPYLLASIARGACTLRQFTQPPIVDQPGKSAAGTSPDHNLKLSGADDGLVTACALTSIALLLVGLKGKTSNVPTNLNRRKSSVGSRAIPGSQSSPTTLQRAQRMLGRIVSVALPFYATLALGGDRVALVMLVALAADIIRVEAEITELKTIKGWRRLVMHRRWTLASIAVQFLYDLAESSDYTAAWKICIGYLALAISVLLIPPPFPSPKFRSSLASPSISASTTSISRVLATQWEAGRMAKPVPELPLLISPLVSSPQDINLTLAAGAIAGAFSFILFLLSGSNYVVLSLVDFGFAFLSAGSTALSFIMVQPYSVRQNSGLGILIGSVSSLVLMTFLRDDKWTTISFQAFFVALSFLATTIDTHLLVSISARSEQHHYHHTPSPMTSLEKPSRFSNLLIQKFQHWSLLHSILVEKDSRRIFYFMSLNLVFMFVQTFYGVATGSLGLLSDSIHMFFDCIALVVGLCAAVMSKWPPSIRFPYGYGKVDTLAGFANGIFLMLISIEIVYEAIERLSEGSKMQRLGELLTVSSLGLVVNLIGITAFGHAHHGHSHGGHDHSDHSQTPHTGHDHSSHSDHSQHPHASHSPLVHSHDVHSSHEHTPDLHQSHVGHDHSDYSHHSHASHDHNGSNTHDIHHHPNNNHNHSHLTTHLTPSPYPITPAEPLHSHSHGHGHAHGHAHSHHGTDNMHGIYLHVLADTLGSVAVVISTLLIHFYGWAGFDPLASCLIAILIFASAIPLVISSAKTLLLTIPEDSEFDLRETLAGISGLRGVVGYAVPKFWLKEGEEKKVLGVIHVIAVKGVDMDDVKERALVFLRGRGMDVLVQVEREGSDRCWCRGGTKAG